MVFRYWDAGSSKEPDLCDRIIVGSTLQYKSP